MYVAILYFNQKDEEKKSNNQRLNSKKEGEKAMQTKKKIENEILEWRELYKGFLF